MGRLSRVDQILDKLAGKAPPVIIRRHSDFERQETRKLRSEALTNQDNKCRYCRDPLHTLNVTAEHKKPRKMGGKTEANNITASCQPCNSAKQIMTDGEFMREIKQPRRACRGIRRAAGLQT